MPHSMRKKLKTPFDFVFKAHLKDNLAKALK
jgi:hypothetical protein